MKRSHSPSGAAAHKHGHGMVEAGMSDDPGPDVTARLFKRVQKCVAPATPVTWNRYIDSRMKQFCSTSR
jgi:hypothetical protein